MTKKKEEKEYIDPAVWLRNWLNDKGATYDYRRDSVILGSTPMKRRLLIDRLISEAHRTRAHIRDRLLDAEVNLWLEEEARHALQILRHRLSFKDHGDGQVRAWVRAVTGAEELLTIRVVQHFIWQVKRKLWNLEVIEHLMPVLFGPQHSGKSTALKKLLTPVESLLDLAGLEVLEDERQKFRLARCYVTFFDEMEGASKAQIEKVKNRITADDVTWRILGLNATETGRQVSTLIGASNRPVAQLLVDPTGMRRFAEIRTLPKMDWAAINKLNPLELWQSVDENRPAPILDVADELHAHQEELKAGDPVDMFFDAMTKPTEAATMAATALFQEFVGWCRRMAMYPVSIRVFGDRAKERVGTGGWKKTGGLIKYAVAMTYGNEPQTPMLRVLEQAKAAAK